MGTGHEINHKEFGKVCHDTRKGRGIRQDHLAAAMGISKTYLCYLERGKKKWTQDIYDSFLKNLNKMVLRKVPKS